MKYIIAIDQSTSCTKAMLFDESCNLISKKSVDHRQLINDKGWVEHDGNEIYSNLITAVHDLIASTAINPSDVVSAGLSTQRETTIAWNKKTGEPFYNAIVWQCSRAKDICSRLEKYENQIKDKTGIKLSPYFSAAKMTWLLENVNSIDKSCCIMSNIDAFLIFRLSNRKAIKTDYSNACRTQLFNINTLDWDNDLISVFGLRKEMLPEVCDSDSEFCMTDFEGILPHKIPLHAALGDSQSALFAQGCITPGLVKATYGTGSSVMMNTGDRIIDSDHLSTSLAWKIAGKINYVIEGNVNYSGATIKWLVDDLQLLDSASEAGNIAEKAVMPDGLYLVPAFTGLGAPVWDQDVRAMVLGMDRTVGKAEFVRAAEESIAYQITDVLMTMQDEANIKIQSLRTDGGPTRDTFLMQFQSDISTIPVVVASVAELSGKGVAMAAGLAIDLYDKSSLFSEKYANVYTPSMNSTERNKKYSGWAKAINIVKMYKI